MARQPESLETSVFPLLPSAFLTITETHLQKAVNTLIVRMLLIKLFSQLKPSMCFRSSSHHQIFTLLKEPSVT